VGAGKTTFYEAYLKEAFPTLVPPLRHQQQPFLEERRSFAVEDIRVDTQLLDEAKAGGYSTKVLFISTEDANLNVGRVLVRMSRGGQAVPVSSVIDSYQESTKNLSEVPKHADELLVYDNTAHRRGFRVVAHFIGGELSKTAQTRPDWAAKVFGKELHTANQPKKLGRRR
jgi:predicted ABC-type ATPase